MNKSYLGAWISFRLLTVLCLIGIILALLFSCKRFVDIPLPENQLESVKVFKGDGTATSAIMGLYAQMMSASLSLTNGGLSVYCGLSADEIYNTQSGSDGDPFFTNALTANNSTIYSNFWSSSYRNIYQINAILSGLANSQSLSDSVKEQLTGQAELIRGFYYFYLVNLFGEVPLVTSTNYQLNAGLSRSSVDDVYQKIISDLTDAQKLLPDTYPSDKRIWPNRYAASALLARTFLYQEDWSKVDSLTTDIVESSLYHLTPDLNDVFSPDNPGIIWQLEPNGFYNTVEGEAFIPSSNAIVPSYALTKYLLSSFEPNDLRRKDWVDSNIVNNQVYFYPYKCKVRTGGPPYLEYNIVVRLAEVYLMRAEARAHLGNIAGALEDLHDIRQRAGLMPINGTIGQDSCLKAILHESRVEFFAEFGHRWFDLKRTHRADGVLGLEKDSWKSNAALYPIPLAEINLDPDLTQNSGY